MPDLKSDLKPDLISDYLDALTRELSFDPALARRMREEAEDHLREAVASDPMGATIETERRAISRFGSQRDIAAQCALPSLVKQAKNVGAAAPLIAISVLVTMKSRIVWYGATPQPIGDDPYLDNIRAIISSIDRYAFWAALLIAACGCAYMSLARMTQITGMTWRNPLRQSLFLCAAAVVITVASDTALTALKLFQLGWSSSIFVPVLTIGVEIALAVILVIRTGVTTRRLASSQRLFTVETALASEAP